MADDIVERLRNYTLFNPRFAGAAAMMTFCDDMRAAADEIERLRAEVSRMACTCLPYAEPHDGMCSRCMTLRGAS